MGTVKSDRFRYAVVLDEATLKRLDEFVAEWGRQEYEVSFSDGSSQTLDSLADVKRLPNSAQRRIESLKGRAFRHDPTLFTSVEFYDFHSKPVRYYVSGDNDAEELAKKADEGEFHKLPEIVAKLREKIDERERDRRIDPAFATQLREAVAEIEAALGG